MEGWGMEGWGGDGGRDWDDGIYGMEDLCGGMCYAK